MGVIVRTLSASAVSVRKWAERLGLSVLRAGGGGKAGVFSGYMARAVGDKRTVIVTVWEPDGVVVIPEPANEANGTAYRVGTRDAFDSRVASSDGPYAREDIPIEVYAVESTPVGFEPDNPSWQARAPRPGRHATTAFKDRVRVNAAYIHPVTPGFPYALSDQVPTGTDVFVGVDVYPRARAAPSYYFGADAIAALAPGYAALPHTDVGYMTWQYQGMSPTTAGHGSTTLAVIPVVRSTGASAAHWGNSGVLFVLLDAQAGEAAGQSTPVVWSRLWTPDEHSYDFLHNGPWHVRPSGSVTSQYAGPNASWDAFWADWDAAGSPMPAGGSRPNWTDAISATWFHDAFVVNLRVCALNGAQAAPTNPTYIAVSGYGNMRFRISLSGGFEAREQARDVWAVKREMPAYDAPYDRWVPGYLDVDTISASHPSCTLSDTKQLVEARVCAAGSRTTAFVGIGGGLTGLMYPRVDMSTPRLEVDVTRLDDAGAPLPPITHRVLFSALGAGMAIPATRTPSADGTFMLLSPLSSYKLHPADQTFALLSDNELAFVVRAYWQAIYPDDPTSVSLAVLNLKTGECSVRGSMGFLHHERLDYSTAIHLNCIQRTVTDAAGTVVVEGVLLASCTTEAAVRISRDGGATWAEYIDFPAPQSGAYYIGNPIMAVPANGSAVL